LFDKKNKLDRKLDKLEKELDHLRVERQRAASNVTNWKAKMNKAIIDNKPEEYEKAHIKHLFYTKRLEQIFQDKDIVEAKIAELKKQKVKGIEQEKADKFKKEAIRLLTAISQALKKGNYIQALSLIDNLNILYSKEKGSLGKEFLKPLEYLGTQSMKLRISHILEEEGETTRISITKGPQIAAQKRANVELWTKHLLGQIDSAIEMFKDKA